MSVNNFRYPGFPVEGSPIPSATCWPLNLLGGYAKYGFQVKVSQETAMYASSKVSWTLDLTIFGFLQGIVLSGPQKLVRRETHPDAHEAQRGGVMDIVICRSPRPDRRGGADMKPLAPPKTRAKVYNKVVLPSTRPTFDNVHAAISRGPFSTTSHQKSATGRRPE
ncbi:hypothetical protein CORC01_14284 [Colletotrichum orchidophilum]|uniref:Uncharacterized protein n=1 Tax=Colletotrichum orchidophilum TaxID=1209926 RepID=A0A1G4AMM6_9PEZI|nr:uncharacterized protein CORC01_14284 [Colletotrichum orchidophilum]OHE90424.1 hypothetical protein CORC01_14284 [Colletotrichum orchidophilum]